MKTSIPEAVTIAAQCFGVSVAVQCRPEEAAAVSAHLPLGSISISPSKADHIFFLESRAENGFSIRRSFSTKSTPAQPLASTLKTLQKELYICIAEHARHYAFIHAGVVEWKDRLIIFPGFSYAGKSTLVWFLIQAGAVYYSDEYAVFDERGCVHPFALPISLRSHKTERQMVLPNNIGSSPRPPDLIAFAKYRAGASWKPDPLSPAATVLELVRHAIAIRRNPMFVLHVLKQAGIQSRSFIGIRDEPKQLLDWLNCIV
jgi:hypothetical protein